jgi:hypothetical protein
MCKSCSDTVSAWLRSILVVQSEKTEEEGQFRASVGNWDLLEMSPNAINGSRQFVA